MSDHVYQYLIVGSGAGGATLARELSRRGKEVLVVEAGGNKFPPPFVIEKSREGTDVFTSYGTGGATVLMNANAVRSLEDALAGHGVVLGPEFAALEDELKIAPIHDSLLSEGGSLEILRVCQRRGIGMRRMPKLMDHHKCIRCGNCSLGCPTGAKWTALEYLRDAEAQGARVLCDTKVERVIVEHGRARGVEAIGPDGPIQCLAEVVILAAGGIKTPVILQSSGLDEAGQNLFIDICELWFGLTPQIDISGEPPMQLVNTEFLASEGFIHSIGYVKNKEKLNYYFKGSLDTYRSANHVSVIVKIHDEPVGRVFPDGSFSKTETVRDRQMLDKGGEAARDFLLAIGARPETIAKREGLYGGHNGASAAIGTVVDRYLQTRVDHLFVCDGSVLPQAPGLPPVLTIMALARWFAKTLA